MFSIYTAISWRVNVPTTLKGKWLAQTSTRHSGDSESPDSIDSYSHAAATSAYSGPEQSTSASSTLA